MTEHDVSIDTDDIDPADPTDLEGLADRCDEQIEWLSYKITEGRIHDYDSFNARLKAVRALSTMVRTRLQVEEKMQLDDLNRELAELEAELEREGQL